MKKLFSLCILLLAVQATAFAQTKEASVNQTSSRKSTPVSKDRTYWQNDRNVRKAKKKPKKCDCPSQMTEKQRRKYRYKS